MLSPRCPVEEPWLPTVMTCSIDNPPLFVVYHSLSYVYTLLPVAFLGSLPCPRIFVGVAAAFKNVLSLRLKAICRFKQKTCSDKQKVWFAALRAGAALTAEVVVRLTLVITIAIHGIEIHLVAPK